MPNTLRAVIFDLDGVLADSEPWWNEIDAQLLAHYGVTYRGEYHRDVLGVNYRAAIEFYQKTYALNASAEEMMRHRAEAAGDVFARCVGLFPAARSVLEELQRLGLRLAVATSSVGASARPFLNRHNLTSFFDVIVTGDEVEHGKPHPDIYLSAAEKLGFAPGACLVIEDSLSGIAAAQAANMRVVAIPDRRFVDARDYEQRAEFLADSLSVIPQLVRGIDPVLRANTSRK
jgi:HAD superfamily hydrolase (TIGR01509 family)